MLITLDKPSEISRHCGVVLGEALIVAHQRVGGGELGLNRVGLEVREQKREVTDCSKEAAPSQLSRRWQVAWERPRTTSVLGRDRSVASCRVDLDLEWRVALLGHRKTGCVRQKSAKAGPLRQQAAPAPGDLHAKVGVDALRALVKNKGERVWPVAFKQHLVDMPCALCTAELCAAHQVPSQREGIEKKGRALLDGPSSKPKARMIVRSGCRKPSPMSLWMAVMMPTSYMIARRGQQPSRTRSHA
jgi:hypothetical protein